MDLKFSFRFFLSFYIPELSHWQATNHPGQNIGVSHSPVLKEREQRAAPIFRIYHWAPFTIRRPTGQTAYSKISSLKSKQRHSTGRRRNPRQTHMHTHTHTGRNVKQPAKQNIFCRLLMLMLPWGWWENWPHLLNIVFALYSNSSSFLSRPVYDAARRRAVVLFVQGYKLVFLWEPITVAKGWRGWEGGVAIGQLKYRCWISGVTPFSHDLCLEQQAVAKLSLPQSLTSHARNQSRL